MERLRKILRGHTARDGRGTEPGAGDSAGRHQGLRESHQPRYDDRDIPSLILLPTQPGHEYTKGNVKFGIQVMQSEPIKKLQAFAEQNKQTQGQFTIGDEKVSA